MGGLHVLEVPFEPQLLGRGNTVRPPSTMEERSLPPEEEAEQAWGPSSKLLLSPWGVGVQNKLQRGEGAG